ncbi:RNA polymerase II-associated protein 1 [Oncorhynchus keta]|uniref:RNA polymerase II-associated protein 1 n=1 Tax=Oncorhynchus keta TaxID=8018 RepID=UPI0015F96922|nr:RNA polymerase II-associated protein 1 [Oncorhynchus keta]XP_035608489.1 RNA polymerase II-associated protein 1 [Oncorhynchus keta]
MIRRPKPTDSEADLLEEQERFLASGTPSTVNVVRRPDKRSGDTNGAQGDQRDVVTIQDLPDELPTLTPAPPKKSRLKVDRVRFEDEDPEERLDRHDTHISAVLSKIIERDTSTTPVSLPAFTGLAFPKVLHRPEMESMVPAAGEKRSIFARQIAAQRIKEGNTPLYFAPESRGQTSGPKVLNLSPESTMEMDQPPSRLDRFSAMAGPKLVSGQGLGGSDSTVEMLKIHQENQAKLQAMSNGEILEEQKRLLGQLDPRCVDFVRSRKAQGALSSAPQPSTSRDERLGEQRIQETVMIGAKKPEQNPLEVEMEREEDEDEPTPQSPMKEEDLPVKPQKEWVHMDKLEPEKLEWIRDLPAPRRKGTKQAMLARFDFAGTLIPPTEDLPTHLGLHHHGEEPELAGYSLQELFLLSRSQVIQQRRLALNTLAHVLTKARAGEFAAALRGSVVSTLLDAGLLFLLRFSLDDNVEGVVSAAVHALRALLVSSDDEDCLDSTLSWFRGLASFPLLPTAQEEEDEEDEGLPEVMRETAQEKEEKKTDHDVARNDVVKGLLRMKLLPRLRYILEVIRPSPRVVQDVLGVLIRIARHSSSAATQVLDCPRLMGTVMSEFLPCSWTVPASPTPQSAYGLPVANAMKLLRVLATTGRHACARLLNSLGARERLSRLLAPEPSELLLEPEEALRVSTEAYRLWAVAASYGQACNLYTDLYPILVRVLQSAHRPRRPSETLLPLELHRLQALLTLLTQVTHTAGCHQELQAGLVSSQGDECPPPPPVTWGHVTGLQPTVLGLLKGCVRTLGEPVQRESTLRLVPAYLVYMGAFYSQLSIQSSFNPVECLQELEMLTSEVLLPLLSHEAVHSLINNLKCSSAVCNPQSCCPSPETIPSLPGLHCAGWTSAGGLPGPNSPFPLITSLCYLLDTLTSIHRGLVRKFSSLLLFEAVLGYLRGCGQAKPTLSHWVLRHEHHLLYLLLRLACRLVPTDPEVAKHAALFHHVSLVMLPWLLPGSEYLAHELMATMVFNKDFIPEGQIGGPEAAEMSELRVQERSSPPLQTLGPLLREACVQLPFVRGCYLSHLAHMEPSVLSSRDFHLGRTPWLNTQLLPELSGPFLPSDWPFLPLVSLYERAGAPDGGGLQVESLPAGAVQSVTHCLQWLLLLEVWREDALRVVLPVAKLARLACIFLCSSDLFMEMPVQRLTWALFRLLTRPSQLEALDLNSPPTGLASFNDLYSALVGQFEAVSFGDPLFGCVILLPLQRRFSVTMRLTLFGEHVGLLRSLGVTLEQLAIPMERFTSPPEDSLPLLRLYFRALVTGTLRLCWCPVLYVVALSHLNTFIFSQDAASQVQSTSQAQGVDQQVETARRSLLRKTHYLTDEVLRSHLLLFRLPQKDAELGFNTYDQLPPIRQRRLESVLGTQGTSDSKGE